jgi:lysophospholipase L1-like esterase
LFALILAFNTFFSSLVFAENNVKPNLVSLGDSITHGWNLGDDKSPTQPISEKAFPYLIGNGSYIVGKNISGGGWNSGELLTEISKPENAEAISNADVITLNIGSNDFLKHPAFEQVRSNPLLLNDPSFLAAFQTQLGILIPQISGNLYVNLGLIIDQIRSTNKNDPQIILYNIYNPFADTLVALYPLGEQLLAGVTGVNTVVYQRVAMEKNVLLADSFTKFKEGFKGVQSDFIFPNDVHPNETGQQVLATLSTSLLAAQVPADITVDLTPSTTEQTKDPVTVTVSSTAQKVLAIQWLAGEKTIADFASVDVGTDITDNKFQVTENGTYTVYVRDSKGAKAVKSIKIENIKAEDPTPNPGDPGNNPDPTPGDPGNNPDPAPGDTGNNPDPAPGDTDNNPDPTPGDTGNTPDPDPVDTEDPAPTTDNSSDNDADDSGIELPNTASAMYNYLAAGLSLILAGLAVLKIQNLKRSES